MIQRQRVGVEEGGRGDEGKAEKKSGTHHFISTQRKDGGQKKPAKWQEGRGGLGWEREK